MPNYTGTSGDDLFDLVDFPHAGDIYNGRGGRDSIRISSGSLTGTGDELRSDLRAVTITNFEELYFGWSPQTIYLTETQASQFTTIVGTGGSNTLVIDVASGGSYLMPEFTLEHWDATDHIALNVSGPDGTTLQARNGVASVQDLWGGAGDDILIGSNGADYFSGGLGADTISGGAGDDVISYYHFAIGGSATVQDYTQDVVNGGKGSDLLEIFGQFLVGEVANVERVNFAEDEYDLFQHKLVFSSDLQAVSLVTRGHYSGKGGVTINVTSGKLNASAITVEEGSEVRFLFNGTSAADVITGTRYDDTINGFGGSDTLKGGFGADHMTGGDGADIYYVDNAGDIVVESGSSSGIDAVRTAIDYAMADGVERLTLLSTARNATGNDAGNAIIGNNSRNILSGGAGNDRIEGRDQSDQLFGDVGDDILIGGTGRDILTGGMGADIFKWFEGDFAGLDAATADRVLGFRHTEGDRIDLRAVDAIAGGADNPFHFIGTEAFGDVAGQLRYQIEGKNTMIYGDIDGDGMANFAIRLNGHHDLIAGDFLL